MAAKEEEVANLRHLLLSYQQQVKEEETNVLLDIISSSIDKAYELKKTEEKTNQRELHRKVS